MCLIYLDGDTPLQMFASPHSLFSGVCVCVFFCARVYFLRQGASFLSAGWRGGQRRAECLVPVCRHGQSLREWALPPRGENESSFFIIFAPNSHSAPVHLDNRIGLEIAWKEEEATKRIKRDVFTCLAFSWQSYPGRAYSRIICMLSCWPNSYISFI